MNEHDLAVLTRTLPEYHLEAGDLETIVHVYAGGKGFEVEFTSGAGDVVAVVTLDAKDIRSINHSEILHVRSVTA